MSKKIAAGAHAIVLDVKVGIGAFMKTIEEARRLAELMVAIGKLSGREVIAVLSDMNQPLGQAVGNALELKEAIDTLNGNGPADFLDHCLTIASYMLFLGKKADKLASARIIAEDALNSGKALEKFRQLVVAQSGDVSFIDHPEKLPKSPHKLLVNAERSGYLSQVHAQIVGETAVDLGAGRIKKSDPIDPSVGILVHVKVGDHLETGEPLFTVYSKNTEDAEKARKRLLAALRWSDSKVKPLPLFYGVIGQV